MKLTTEEFASSFHSLSGTTIGERRKNLFHLLQQTKKTDTSELNFSAIEPKTFLEEKFKLEVLIYFRRVAELLDLLKCENPLLINKILKSGTWFLEEAFDNVTGEQLVTQIFPYVSFNVKEKLVNKLASYLKNEQQADECYHAINKKYGCYLASKLLCSCSIDLIMNCLKATKFIFTPRQLQVVVDRFPQKTEDILDDLYNKVGMGMETNYYDYGTLCYEPDVGDAYKNVFISLAKRDLNLFFKLNRKYKMNFQLGWRLTDKFMRQNKEQIIQKPVLYIRMLHNKRIGRSLHHNYSALFLNLFPKRVEDIKDMDKLTCALEWLPINESPLNLLLSTFKKAYNHELWDYPEFVTRNLLNMFNPEERKTNIKAEFKPPSISEAEWCSYMDIERSLPLLKQQFCAASNDFSNKSTILHSMIRTCKINADYMALGDVCKFMVNRQPKEYSMLGHRFLTSLMESFDLEELHEQHWIFVNKLLQMTSINNEECGERYFQSYDKAREFRKVYIHYCLVNGLPVKEHLINWLKGYETLNICQNTPKYEKQCLLTFGELIPEMFRDKDHRKHQYIDFCCALISWNDRNPLDQISLFTYTDIMDSIKQVASTIDCYSIRKIANYFLHTKIDAEERTKFLTLYLLNPYSEYEVINWLAKHEPLIILQNLTTLMPLLLQRHDFYYFNEKTLFWSHCRNYSHLKIPEKVISTCINAIQEETKVPSECVVTNALICLSYLTTPAEFVKLIIPYHPAELQANPKSEEGRKIYEIQRYICICLKNILPSQALQSVLVFCKGDYLKLVLPTLYWVSNKLNEDKLAPFFSELTNRAVSVRKHAIYLSFRVFDKQQVWNILNKFMETDKNVSIRKFIFKCSFNYFVKNMDEYSWELVKLNADVIDLEDAEAFQLLLQADKIPQQYLSKYITFMWEFLSKFPNKRTERTRLLNLATAEVIPLLSEEFCKMIINKHLFNYDGCLSYLQSVVQSFTCRYIIYCNCQLKQEERLTSYFKICTDFINVTWNNPSFRDEGRNYVTNFIKSFCWEFLDGGCTDKQILIKFANLWSNIFKPHETFDMFLHLQFTLIYLEKLPMEQLAYKLAAVCDSLLEIYGPYVIGMFHYKINSFNVYFFDDHEYDGKAAEKRYLFIESLVKSSSCNMHLLLATLLLRTPKNEEGTTKYYEIVQMLEKMSDPVIQLYVQSHISGFKNLTYKF